LRSERSERLETTVVEPVETQRWLRSERSERLETTAVAVSVVTQRWLRSERSEHLETTAAACRDPYPRRSSPSRPSGG